MREPIESAFSKRHKAARSPDRRFVGESTQSGGSQTISGRPLPPAQSVVLDLAAFA